MTLDRQNLTKLMSLKILGFNVGQFFKLTYGIADLADHSAWSLAFVQTLKFHMPCIKSLSYWMY